jgi:RNA polymerase sigma-70 factor (ECF subfamily)
MDSSDSNSLDVLIDKLSSGDSAAAEEVFQTYAPSLRSLVRKMLPPNLRSKFDSADVVQSVFADLWQGFQEAGWRFASPAHLRAFLIQVTRNRFIDRLRQTGHHPTLQALDGELEQVPAAGDRPSEVAQADELWQRLLTICPPQHRVLLELRRAGHTFDEIARATGLHEGSVRRVLYDLARKLAAKS